MNKTYYSIAAVVVLGGIVFWLSTQGLLSPGTEQAGESDTTSEVPVDEGVDEIIVADEGDESGAEADEKDVSGGEREPIMSATISFTGGSFEPSSFEVDVGATVTFKNISQDKTMWPATAIHPTHTVYPGSSIGKCGTDEADGIFDACKNIGPGDSYSFTFDEVGEWKYHDHLKPSITGTIIVK